MGEGTASRARVLGGRVQEAAGSHNYVPDHLVLRLEALVNPRDVVFAASDLTRHELPTRETVVSGSVVLFTATRVVLAVATDTPATCDPTHSGGTVTVTSWRRRSLVSVTISGSKNNAEQNSDRHWSGAGPDLPPRTAVELRYEHVPQIVTLRAAREDNSEEERVRGFLPSLLDDLK